LPIEVIKIEIIRASKSCGQNAFTGAEISLQSSLDNDASLRLQAGSYGQFSAAVTAGVSLNESNHILHFQKTYRIIAIIQILTIRICIEECFLKINYQ
jgi:iron complex outermembrane receptor protein